jgi:hypothetical protein
MCIDVVPLQQLAAFSRPLSSSISVVSPPRFHCFPFGLNTSRTNSE